VTDKAPSGASTDRAAFGPVDPPAAPLGPAPSWARSALARPGSVRWSLSTSLTLHAAVLCAVVLAVGEPTKFEGKEEDAISIDIVSVEEVAAPDPSPSPSVAVSEVDDTVEPTEAKEAEAVADPTAVASVEPRPVEVAREPPLAETPRETDAKPSETEPRELEPVEPAKAPEEPVAERAAVANDMPEVLAHAGGDPTDPVPPAAARTVEPVTEALEPASQTTEAKPVETAAIAEPVPDEKPAAKPKPEKKKPEKPKPSKQKEAKKEAERKASGKALASAQEGTGSTGAQSRKASGNASMSNYIGQIAARLQRQKRYPDSAKRRGIGGTVLISFTISGSGSVTGSKLVRSSGTDELDREVRAMLDRASPFPPIPDDVGRTSLTITVPIRFSLR